MRYRDKSRLREPVRTKCHHFWKKAWKSKRTPTSYNSGGNFLGNLVVRPEANRSQSYVGVVKMVYLN